MLTTVQDEGLELGRRLCDAAQSYYGPVRVSRLPALAQYREAEPAQVARIAHHDWQPSTAAHAQAHPLVRRWYLVIGDRRRQGVAPGRARRGQKCREAQVANGAHPCEHHEGLGEVVDRPGWVKIQRERVDVRRVLEQGHDARIQGFVYRFVVPAFGDVYCVPADDVDGTYRLCVAR